MSNDAADVADALCRWGYATVPGFVGGCDKLQAEASALLDAEGRAQVGEGSSELGLAVTRLRELGRRLGIDLAERQVRSPFGVVAAAHESAMNRAEQRLGPNPSTLLSVDLKAQVSKRRAGCKRRMDGGKVITAVLYLNNNWNHGGELQLERPGLNKSFDIPPRAGLLVVFWSSIVKFQIQPATKDCFALSLGFKDVEPIENTTTPTCA